jgi:excinuclease ABC subunit C
MATGAPRAIAGLPAAAGVYRFRDARGRVLYIGRATTLRTRVASYWSDLRDRAHLAPMVARIVRVEAVSCDSLHEAAWLERNLLQTWLPPWNRTPGGQENVVFIRMDLRPLAPGLTVEHVIDPARTVQYFGPYLGGRRGRLGARRTGTPPRPRCGCACVRARSPDPRRDRGADWVTCPQRVTSTDGGDVDVYGWSAAVLLYLGIRDGRVSQWSQRSCSQTAAEPLLATTPASWTDFAQRNAELAAALAGQSP